MQVRSFLLVSVLLFAGCAGPKLALRSSWGYDGSFPMTFPVNAGRAFAISQEGGLIAGCDYTGQSCDAVRVLDAETFEEVQSIEVGKPSSDFNHAVAIAPDGSWLATFSAEQKKLKVVEPRTGKVLHEDSLADSGRKWGAIVSPRGERVAVSKLGVFDTSDWSMVRELDEFADAAFSADGQYIVSHTVETVTKAKTEGGGTAWTFEFPEPVKRKLVGIFLAVSPDGKHVAVTRDGEIFLLDAESGALIDRKKGKDSAAALSVSFSADGAQLAVGHMKGLALFDVSAKSLKPVREVVHQSSGEDEWAALRGYFRGDDLLVWVQDHQVEVGFAVLRP